ncbi:MAG TPA: sigma 54-interacting transcriptional regulator [Thermoanaerobaculia bacterium]|nr:sigma 54-interacting transcriptional regulator [Thermoanaerobaculia bacterium]
MGFERDEILSTVWEGVAERRSRRSDGRDGSLALTILCHPDVRRVGERAVLRELAAGNAVALSRLQPELAQPGETLGRPLADRRMSRTPVWIKPLPHAEGTEAVQLDTRECPTPIFADGVQVQGVHTLSKEALAVGVVLELSSRSVLLLHHIQPSLHRLGGPGDLLGLVGHSDAVAGVRQRILQVADLDFPVLVRGETGTGKELAASAIHAASRRRSGPFVSLNMGAVPASLAASELFGAVKGSFTGAVRDQPGYFQRAHGGSLFLDEVGETPVEVQPLLLRVLESGEIQRVGASTPVHVDVRLIAATDSNLESAVEQGRFRAPLLHRLAGYEILLPPLRERRDDFGRLLFHFLRAELRALHEEEKLLLHNETEEPWLGASVIAGLARHPWPGNLRQLRNVAREIVVGSRGFPKAQIGPQIERLLREVTEPVQIQSATPPPIRLDTPPPGTPPPIKYRSPSEVSTEELMAALRANRWEIKPTAAQLGVARPSLYLMMEKLPGLRKAGDLGRAEILEAQNACNGNLEAMVDHLEVSKPALLQRMKRLGLV